MRRDTKRDLPSTTFWGKADAGFTLIEILIVIALVGTLAGVGGYSLFGIRNRRVLDSDADKIMSQLNSTRERSRAQEAGEQWGIHLVNPDGDGNDFYEVWRGTSYASGVVVERVNINSGVIFTTPSASSTQNVVFAKGTGLPTVSSTMVLESKSSGTSITITISSQGLVSSTTTGG